MRFYLRKEVYFEIEIENSSDRAVATSAFNDVIEPSFNNLIQKIRFEKTEQDAIRKFLGQNVNVRMLSKVDFLKISNQRNISEQ